eukprot:scaffold429694_cov46-Prasinocladus_malaysianus.AAC.1
MQLLEEHSLSSRRYCAMTQLSERICGPRRAVSSAWSSNEQHALGWIFWLTHEPAAGSQPAERGN